MVDAGAKHYPEPFPTFGIYWATVATHSKSINTERKFHGRPAGVVLVLYEFTKNIGRSVIESKRNQRCLADKELKLGVAPRTV